MSASAPEQSRRRWVSLALVLLAVAAAVAVWDVIPQINGHYGVWSVVPPLVAIVLAFWTREVIPALFAGIVTGGMIAGQLNIVDAFLIPAIATEGFALILLVYLWALGGLIGIWSRTGGALAFANWAGRHLTSGPRSAKLFAWLIGLVFHQGGTVSTVLTGATVRPVADRHRVSHEELSYMVDSTASPAATLIPFNVWPIYVAGLVVGTVPFITSTQEGILFFFQSIPLNFFAILTLLITLLFALEKLPWIPGRRMREAIRRARETGKLDDDDAQPLSAVDMGAPDVPEGYRTGLIDFFGPIAALIGFSVVPFMVSYFVLGHREDPAFPIAAAFVLAVLVAVMIATLKGMPLRTVMDGFIDGCKSVIIGGIILMLAVSLKEVAEAVGTAEYLVEVASGQLTPLILPGLLMVLCMVIAFATGTSFGTYAVVFPIAMPLAWAVHPEMLFMMICFGAIMGGALFGDKCSPISDTTILSSLATGCDLMDHVYTQIPLALTAAGLSIVGYTVMVMLFI